MNLKCMLGFHAWSGCKCEQCGKTRDQGHDWANDCETCASCGKTRDEGHDWRFNCHQCSKCGKTRDKAHDWTTDCEHCALCSSTQWLAHRWDGCKCSVCGKTRDQEHKGNGRICSVCGSSRDAELTSELLTAVADHNSTRAAAVLASGADVNARCAIRWNGNNWCNGQHKTALWTAAWRTAPPEVIRLLIAANADVNAKMEYDGQTALHEACAQYARPDFDEDTKSRLLEGARLLIAANADVNVSDDSGKSPLDLASSGGNLGETGSIEDRTSPMLELLLESGASPVRTGGAKERYCSTHCYELAARKVFQTGGEYFDTLTSRAKVKSHCAECCRELPRRSERNRKSRTSR